MAASPAAAPGARPYEPRRIIRNFSAAVMGEGLSRGAAFFATLVIARALSEGDFGRFSFVLALVSVGLLLSDVGLQVVATRGIAADRARAAEYVTGSLAIGVVFGAVGYALVTAAGVLGLLPGDVTTAVAVFGAALVLAAVANPSLSLLRGFERQDLVYLILSLSSVFLLGAVLFAATREASVEVFSAVYLASFALRLVATLAVVRLTLGRVGWQARWTTTKGLLVAAPTAALAYILLGVYSHVDVVLLGFLVPAEDVGAYAAAYRLVDAVTFLTAGAMATALFPVFSRLAREAPESVAPLYDRATRLMATGLVPVAILLCAFADPIIRIVFDFEGDEAARVFALLAPATLLISLNFTTAFLAMAVERTRAAIWSAGVAAVVNVLIIFVGVPLFGIRAAAVATLVAEAAMLGVFQVLLARDGLPARTAATAALAAALVAPPVAVALALPDERLWVGPAGAAAALILAKLTGLFVPDDAAALKRALRRRPAAT